MKWVVRITALVIVLAVVAVTGTHLFLKHRLVHAIRRRVSPTVEEQLGVAFEVDDASADIFKGTVQLDGVRLGNPEGYTEPDLLRLQSLALNVGLADLLRGRVLTVARFSVEKCELTIERTRKGQVNLDVIHERAVGEQPAAPPLESPSPPGSGTPSEPRPPVELPRLQLREGAFDMFVHYVDQSIGKDGPLKLTLRETLSLDGLTLGMEAAEWSRFEIEGGLSGDETVCATAISGRIAPVRDLSRLSFELEGDIANVAPELVDYYLGKNDLSCDVLTVHVQLKCEEGQFDPDVSTIALVMTNVELPEKVASEMPGGITRLERLSVPIGVGGTLQDPHVDGLLTALLRTALQNLQDNPQLQQVLRDSLAKLLGVDEEGEKKEAGEGEPAGETDSSPRDELKKEVLKAAEGILDQLFK